MPMSERIATLIGRLETWEVAYDHITSRELIESRPDENSDGVYRFDDGREERTLPAAVDYAQTLHRFASNQLRQSAG